MTNQSQRPNLFGQILKRVLVLLVAVAVFIYAFSIPMNLLTEKDDISVLFGVLSLILYIGAIAYFGFRYIKSWIGLVKKYQTSFNGSNSLILLPALFLLAALSSCTTVPPGYVGIKINSWGSAKGVQDMPLETGMVNYNFFTSSVYKYPTYVQTAIWTKSLDEGNPVDEEITFNTKEGTNVSCDVSLSYELSAAKVPAFYVKFRSDDIDRFTHGFLRNTARDAFNEVGAGYALEEVYGLKKEEFLKRVRDIVNTQLSPFGVHIVQFGFTGGLRMDPSIMAALNKKLKTVQDAIAAENMLRQKTAEAEQKVATAKGDAEANRLMASSITPQLVQWEQLQITRLYYTRWDGHKAMVEGGGNGMLLQIPVPSAAAKK